ncbi:hypothetical protein V5G24_25590 [Xanthobacter sp. VTT E-85241]|uniref:hypothetical protein n=1 Tax=Roseixanthobacter finlandensis TaxID=3119922 RepID=UPI00372A7920
MDGDQEMPAMPTPDPQPQPQRSNSWAVTGGVSVILLTGMAAIAKLHEDGGDIGFLALILGVAVAGAFALARFISRHGHEIGEARFDTTPKEPPAA